MLDITYIRENTEKVREGVRKKQSDPSLIDQILKLDQERVSLLQKTEELRRERNEISGKSERGSNQRGKEIKEELKELEPKLKEILGQYEQSLFALPNLPSDDVKEGKNDTENDVVRSWGEKTKFIFKPKDHVELGAALGIIDIDRAVKVSGTRFAYLKGDAVLLEFALVRFAMETLMKESFIPIVPPVLIKKESMQGMGYMEQGGDEEMYIFDKDGMVLVGTSEQSIGPMHQGEVLAEKVLPLRYVSFSSCFRREAGSYGRDTQGILRVHQFDKVEMFSFTRPEDGEKEHEYLLSLEEKLFQSLEIPYQVIKMCSGDLGIPAARTYDIEAWLPGQEKYREVTSTSTTTDYQARRLNIKYRSGNKTEFVHMLNGTAFAIGRTIIAILENYQKEDGSIEIPKVLQEYMGRDLIALKR